MFPTAETLFAFAQSTEGQPFVTSKQKKPFRVAVTGGVLEFTPGSSRRKRQESRECVGTILNRLAKTGSFQPGGYADVSFNASYVLALVQQWQASQTQAHR